jgi:hypothetical protein
MTDRAQLYDGRIQGSDEQKCAEEISGAALTPGMGAD